jgi:biotin operon repressor
MNPYEIPTAVQPLPNRALVLAAIANESRWIILKELAKGEPRMTIELARLIGSSPDATAKQMIMLRRAGLVEQVYGKLYTIPKNICRSPASLSWISVIACCDWTRPRLPAREIGEVMFADGCRHAPNRNAVGRFGNRDGRFGNTVGPCGSHDGVTGMPAG